MPKTTLKFKYNDNVSLIYILKFFGGLVFFLPILALYFQEQLFTITNVALIFAIRAIAQTIFELPTGIIADLFGRKKTYILAQSSYLLALVFLIIGKSLPLFILFAILDGFTESLKSGTDTALIYDTLKEREKTNLFKKISGNAFASSHLGIAIGSIASGYLAAISLSLPILLTFIPAILSLIVSFFLTEPKYSSEEKSGALIHLKSSIKIIFQNKQILLIVGGMFFIAAAFDTIASLNAIWYQFKQVPIQAFGWISAAIFTLAAIGYQQSHNFSEKFGNKKAIMLTVIFPPITILIATFLNKWAAVFFMLLSPLFFGLRTPILKHIIHENISSNKRATVHSFAELIKKLSFAIFAPFAGYLAELYSINFTFQITAIVLFIVPIIYFFLKNE